MEMGPCLEGEEMAAATSAATLPTLQRNALCKLFERADFTPEEVVAVGYRQLGKVNGIGPKGLEIIAAWLAAHGLVLQHGGADRAGRHIRRVELAIRLLERYGYEVRRLGRPDEEGAAGSSRA